MTSTSIDETTCHFSGWPIKHSELHTHYREALTFLNCSESELRLTGTEFEDQDVLTSSIERWSVYPAVGPFYREHLRASKNVTVIAGATVTDIVLDATAAFILTISGFFPVGAICEIRAKTDALAGGGLENARLLFWQPNETGRKNSVEQTVLWGAFIRAT